MSVGDPPFPWTAKSDALDVGKAEVHDSAVQHVPMFSQPPPRPLFDIDSLNASRPILEGCYVYQSGRLMGRIVAYDPGVQYLRAWVADEHGHVTSLYLDHLTEITTRPK